MATETGIPTTGDVTTSESITSPEAVTTKLPQTVEIKDVGPCKKHVKVTVERTAIDARFDEKFSDLMVKNPAHVRGFRPGKAPRSIVQKKFQKEVAAEIKTEILMASLEQLADEQAISPLSPPELDPKTLAIPESGPFIYEFDIEVRPEFDLPSYKGLKLRRPTHTFTDADVEQETRAVLQRLGQIVPKENGIVELDDYITVDLSVEKDGAPVNVAKDVRIKVVKQLALSDGVAPRFGEQLQGAKVGDKRIVDIVISQETPNIALRGTTMKAEFTIHDVKTIKLPELDSALLGYFDVPSVEQFQELIRVRLGKKLEYAQRQALRQQILQQLAKDQKWDLPEDLLRRQARKTLQRRVMEMRSGGVSEEEIAGKQRMMEIEALKSTAAALQEHFVLQKIAELEKIEIEDEDIENEIAEIAERSGESYRKVRARMEKEDLIEPLATELIERKALDLVLNTAEYEDYEMNPLQENTGGVTVMDAEAAPTPPATAETPAPAE